MLASINLDSPGHIMYFHGVDGFLAAFVSMMGGGNSSVQDIFFLCQAM